jgi:hypothetical protein
MSPEEFLKAFDSAVFLFALQAGKEKEKKVSSTEYGDTKRIA